MCRIVLKKRYPWWWFFLDMMKNNNLSETEQDDNGDEFDFYDFLEIAADKIDAMTHQSIKQR
jgi:hypothetical protein